VKSSSVRIYSLILVIAACAVTAAAQTYSLTRQTLGGGGGLSAGGTYLVNGTIGEPAAGTVGAGNYTVRGGFWALIGTVQTPGAPLIRIKMTSTNTVLVAWPSPSTGFILQQSADSMGTNWVNVTKSPMDNGTTRSVLVSPPTANLFFRLKK
jgi:hypothetical protein